jgi:hypothetical protein
MQSSPQLHTSPQQEKILFKYFNKFKNDVCIKNIYLKDFFESTFYWLHLSLRTFLSSYDNPFQSTIFFKYYNLFCYTPTFYTTSMSEFLHTTLWITDNEAIKYRSCNGTRFPPQPSIQTLTTLTLLNFTDQMVS